MDLYSARVQISMAPRSREEDNKMAAVYRTDRSWKFGQSIQRINLSSLFLSIGKRYNVDPERGWTSSWES